jgi:two-component system NarL family sensor kinase
MAEQERRMVSVPRVVLAFALAGLVAVLAAGAVADRAFRRVGRDEAIVDARKVTALAASAVVQPRLTTALLAGDPRAVARLDAAIRRSVLGGDVVRVKLWSAGGRIVYSDAVALRGRRFPAHGAEIRALRDGVVTAEVSNLDAPENRYERRFHKLLEVYLPVRGPHGERLLFESYQRFTAIEASGRRLRGELLPPFAIVLAFLWLIQIPLAFSMARRLRARQRERERLLGRAIDASNEERRRIARDLHDGPVQTLAGVAYGLAAAHERIPAGDPSRGTIERAAGALRETIRELRSLLVVVHPPSLQRSGLQAALDDAAASLRRDGVTVDVAIDGDRLGPESEVVVFRAAQEALRNARSHAAADHVSVRVQGASGVARLRVTDDGRGFDQAAAPPDDHFGLELLAGLVREAGGTLDVDSEPGSGTTVRVEVPA